MFGIVTRHHKHAMPLTNCPFERNIIEGATIIATMYSIIIDDVPMYYTYWNAMISKYWEATGPT